MTADSKYIDQIYYFKGAWDVPSFCGIKIIVQKDNTIVIVTELYDSNPGSSVTSRVDKLATEIMEKFDIERDKLFFIEHNPNRKSKFEFFKETFDLVSFEWNGEKFINPTWERITKGEVDGLIG